MGWFAVCGALMNENGRGSYGTVRDALKGECDPSRTMLVALDEITPERFSRLGPRAKRRVAYYRSRYMLPPILKLPKKQP